MTPDETPRATLAEDEFIIEAGRILRDRGVTIANSDVGRVWDWLAPLLTAARAAGVAQERERIVARLRRLSDEASVRELADHNAYARRCAYDRAARIAEGAEQ